MTLAEMADLVCDKVGKTDPDTQAFVKKCLRRRYQLIWDMHLWKDTLTLATVQNAVYSTAPASAFHGQLLLPKRIERVLAIRRGEDQSLGDQELIHMFLTDPSQFEREGAPLRYSRLHPLAISTWIEEEEEYLQLRSSSTSDVGVTVRVREDAEAGDGSSEDITLNGTSLVNSAKTDYVAPVQIAKPETVGTITVTGYRTGSVLAVLGPKETSVTYARVRLHDTPESEEDYLVLGKTKCANFTEDYDTSVIPGIDDALIAFAQCDLLEKLRQYAKAQAKATEALAQVEKAKNLETRQTTNTVRMVPVVEPAYDYDTTWLTKS
jgi:hypothetical protein